ncbi:hypothetical protein LMG27952_00749 [Paraburkholderia hiiakae]|uniref:Uncharacterized protein n=1 Tax=Paraburkholderia hiiakae TaxID=1081782 RepID=A0ABN7HF87_9BURK|nr:hypothetical protein LMG27952_00749 [Paraburkholderia hiiakae]
MLREFWREYHALDSLITSELIPTLVRKRTSVFFRASFFYAAWLDRSRRGFEALAIHDQRAALRQFPNQFAQ